MPILHLVVRFSVRFSVSDGSLSSDTFIFFFRYYSCLTPFSVKREGEGINVVSSSCCSWSPLATEIHLWFGQCMAAFAPCKGEGPANTTSPVFLQQWAIADPCARLLAGESCQRFSSVIYQPHPLKAMGKAAQEGRSHAAV